MEKPFDVHVLVTVGEPWHFKTTQRNVWVSDVITRRGHDWIIVWPETYPVAERMQFPVEEFLKQCARGYVAR